MFSKMWSENIPVFSYKTSGVIHPERLHLSPQSSENLLVIAAGILVYGYLSMGGHIQEAEKANTAVMGAFVGPP